MEDNSRIRKEVSKSGLDVSRVYASDFQKEGTLTAELKQTVTTKSYYPSKSVANDMQDNIFGMQEFGFEEQEYVNNETRVAWIDVPQGSTMEAVVDKLKAFPNAGLYRVLANQPILTDNQKYAIKEGLTTLDVFADRQVVRYPDNSENAGELALDANGKPQYRQVFFSSKGVEDNDMRTIEAGDYYASPTIKSELEGVGSAHVVEGQTL